MRNDEDNVTQEGGAENGARKQWGTPTLTVVTVADQTLGNFYVDNVDGNYSSS